LRLLTALDGRPDAVLAAFRFVWAEGRSSDDPQAWRELCSGLGVADPEALVTDPAVKDRLRANGETAVARGVFGVPTFVTADGELFWGEDATPMLLDHLSGAPVMRSPEMLRADDLPVAKARPR
jgi:2-hydroxychromene-2-carboxylate isomerase